MKQFYASVAVVLLTLLAVPVLAQVCTLNPGELFCTECAANISPTGVVSGTINVGTNSQNTNASLPADCGGLPLTLGTVTINVRNGSNLNIDGSIGIDANTDLTLTGNGNADIDVNGTTFSIKSNSPPTFAQLQAAVDDCAASGGTCDDLGQAASDAGLLPVELIGWSARPIKQSVRVEWSVASEIAHDFYFLEHSTDGRTFTEVARLASDGFDTREQRSYELTHLPTGGNRTHYYRLGQQDLDGTVAIFGVQAVSMSNDGTAAAIYPNPALAGSQITGLDDDYTARIYDLSGRLSAELPVLGGRIDLPATLPVGTYVVRNGAEQHRLIVR